MDIGNSFENVLDTIIGFLPNLLGFLLILLIGYVIARVVAGVIRKVLEKVGIDQALFTLVDVTGLVIYFSVALVVLRGTLL